MTGRINVYVPRDPNGERLTGPYRAQTRSYGRHLPTRAFFDPDAARNPKCAIPISDPSHPLNPRNVARRAKAGPQRFAPKGWRIANPPLLDGPLGHDRQETPTDVVRAVPDDPPERPALPEGREPQRPMQASSQAAEGRACGTCGRTFRKSGVGLAWHIANAHRAA